MPGRLKGLLFDKDGTLFDFHATWGVWCGGFVDSLAGGDAARAMVLAEAMGFDRTTGRFRKTSPVIAETVDVLVATILRALPDLDAADLRAHVLATTAAAPQVEAVPLLSLVERLIDAGFVLGIATNDAVAVAETHLVRSGVRDRFAFVAGFDSGYGGKPGAGMPDAFCAATGLAPEACAMIGDSTHDLVSGRAAGMITVAVLTGLAERDELAEIADVVLPDIGALPEWLGLEPVGETGPDQSRTGLRRSPAWRNPSNP